MPPEREDELRNDLASLRIERAAPRRKARKPRRWVTPLILVLLVAGAAAAWAVMTRPVPVQVATAQRSSGAETGPAPLLSGSGYVVTGDRYVSIGVRVPGRIDHYFVEEGQSVKKNDPLVQLDDRDYRARVSGIEANIASARADLALADADLARGRALRGDGVISQQELDVLVNKAAVARAAIAQLDAQLEQARVDLDYTLLRAPADGVVLAKLKEVGEIAVPGGFAGSGDLIRLANLTDMRAEVDVNESDLNRVKLGQPAQVTPDAYQDLKYEAEVVKLYPQVDRQKGTLKVEVHILHPDEKLLPDMSARVTFLAPPQPEKQDEPTVLVPATAVHRDTQGDNVVWIVRDGRVTAQIVETAGDVGDKIRIAEGLSGGETVVLGDVALRNGQRVVAE
ncbi:MAG: efflux RND transporter periplasmic adaptor subunit [Deltaproteobacteria bacterium]|nr:efflux RND transporter periplasmic adaptor subunit [Deltaproteobacteria bacterium]